MPKKVSKKLKKGGKAKGKKGKGQGKGKGKGKGEKVDKELVYKEAVAQCKIWEHKVASLEQSREEYREHAQKLVRENESLQLAMRSTEQDTIEVIAYLKREASKKDAQMEGHEEQQKRAKREERKEKERLLAEHRENVLRLNEALSLREQEIERTQSQLKLVKEFVSEREQLLEELDTYKEKLEQVELSCKETMRRTEQRCFEEKLRMHQETGRKMAELAERAHEEAKQNLDETTVSIFKENVRVNEALGLHLQEGEQLRKREKKMQEETTQLRIDRELHQVHLKENARSLQLQRKKLSQLESEVASLRGEVGAGEREREQGRQVALVEREEARKNDCLQLELLQRSLVLKCKELTRVKQAARRVLEQRSDIESFFLDALAFVKKQSSSGKTRRVGERLPPISGGPVRAVEKSRSAPDEAMDVGELSWEQKEQVLRMLFAQMNGKNVFSKRKAKTDVQLQHHYDSTDYLHCSDLISDSYSEEDSSKVFITQSETQTDQITS